MGQNTSVYVCTYLSAWAAEGRSRCFHELLKS